MKRTLLPLMVMLCAGLIAQEEKSEKKPKEAKFEQGEIYAPPGGGFGITKTTTSNNHFVKMYTYGTTDLGGQIEMTKDTRGSAYLFEDFKKGNILEDRKVIYPNVVMKYNVYNDTFIAKRDILLPDTEALKITKTPELQIQMHGMLFVVMTDPSTMDLNYFEEVYLGKQAQHLYKKHGKSYKERMQATTSLTRDVPPEFKDESSYYMGNPAEGLTKLPTSKSKFAKKFGDHAQEIKNFIKKQRLNIKEEKDLEKIIEYYNHLKENA